MPHFKLRGDAKGNIRALYLQSHVRGEPRVSSATEPRGFKLNERSQLFWPRA